MEIFKYFLLWPERMHFKLVPDNKRKAYLIDLFLVCQSTPFVERMGEQRKTVLALLTHCKLHWAAHARTLFGPGLDRQPIWRFEQCSLPKPMPAPNMVILFKGLNNAEREKEETVLFKLCLRETTEPDCDQGAISKVIQKIYVSVTFGWLKNWPK